MANGSEGFPKPNLTEAINHPVEIVVRKTLARGQTLNDPDIADEIAESWRIVSILVAVGADGVLVTDWISPAAATSYIADKVKLHFSSP